jgi:hypothetical protein
VNNDMLGLLCIIIGVALLVVGSPFLWHILIVLLALWLIHYGMVIRGGPGLVVWVARATDEIKSLFKSRK